MSNRFRSTGLPLTAALIWGTAFVVQSVLGKLIPPLMVNALRSVIAALTVYLSILIFRFAEKKKGAVPQKQDRRALIIGGICTGAALTVASNLQQAGLMYTSAGKASFITALYTVLVPLVGLLLGKRISRQVWLAVVLATVGLYLISITGADGFSMEKGDFLVFLCAFGYTAHVLLIDHFTKTVDGLHLSLVQFITCAVLSGILSLLTETADFSSLPVGEWLWPLLYIGVFSSGVAFTLQILAQKGGDPTVVSLFLSLESVFGAIAGALLLHERMSPREITGCVLMFTAVILTQIPLKKAAER